MIFCSPCQGIMSRYHVKVSYQGIIMYNFQKCEVLRGKLMCAAPYNGDKRYMYHVLSKKLVPDEIFSFVIFYIETKKMKGKFHQ